MVRPIWSGYCPVGLTYGMGNVCRAFFRRWNVCLGYVLGQVSVRLLSGRATVRIPEIGAWLRILLSILCMNMEAYGCSHGGTHDLLENMLSYWK